MVPRIDLKLRVFWLLLFNILQDRFQHSPCFSAFPGIPIFQHMFFFFDMDIITIAQSIVWSLQNGAIWLAISKHGGKGWIVWWYPFPVFQMTEFSSVISTYNFIQTNPIFFFSKDFLIWPSSCSWQQWVGDQLATKPLSHSKGKWNICQNPYLSFWLANPCEI